MDQLINKRVLLCVTGGIAAYKSAELVRLFKNSGSDVRVLMTKSAQEFITPLTMQALSGNSIHSDLLDPGAEAAMGHIELARWSDIIVIAPCTADSIAKLALGRGDDLLSAVALSTDAPIFVAPAMNQAMWRDGATQNNISTLAEKNFIFIGPDIGTQACGDTGPGRMTEPSDIIQQVSLNFSKGLLAGKKISVTQGDKTEEYKAQHIIIATGARSRELPNLPQDGQKVIGYRKAMTLEKQPKKLIVVGSGAIGIEFAYFYNAMGTEVTIVEYVDRIVPVEDDEISKQLEKSFKKSGINIMTGAEVTTVDTKGKGVKATVKTAKGEEVLEADVVLSAVGIKSNIENLGLEEVGIAIDKDKIIKKIGGNY